MFNTFYHDIWMYENKFFNYTRITITSFDDLLITIRSDKTGLHSTSMMKRSVSMSFVGSILI